MTDTEKKILNIIEKHNSLVQSTRVKAVQNAYNIKCLAVIGSGFVVLFIAFIIAVVV
jgi:CHASE3 domain sensor protein